MYENQGFYDRERERFLSFFKNFWIPYFAVGGLATLAIFYATINRSQDETRRNQLISEVAPYVEMVDRKPGISDEDIIDFLRRAEIPTHIFQKGQSFSFHQIPLENLEKALKSYESRY